MKNNFIPLQINKNKEQKTEEGGFPCYVNRTQQQRGLWLSIHANGNTGRNWF